MNLLTFPHLSPVFSRGRTWHRSALGSAGRLPGFAGPFPLPLWIRGSPFKLSVGTLPEFIMGVKFEGLGFSAGSGSRECCAASGGMTRIVGTT